MGTAEIITFPTNGATTTDREPKQGALLRIREMLEEPIQGETLEAAKAILKRLNLPPESAVSLKRNEYSLLKEAAEQNCATCIGNRQACEKIVYSEGEGGKIIIDKANCEKKEAYEREKRAREILKKAKIPKIFAGKRASDFISSNGAVLDAAEAAIFDGKSVYIYGGVGTGKTLLASIIATERAYLGKASLFISVAETLESLREFNNQTQKFSDSRTREEKLKEYANAKCLIVDDLGAEKPTDWTVETLFKIFNRRYNECLQNVTTSNLSPEELEKHLGGRVARRILHGAEIVEL